VRATAFLLVIAISAIVAARLVAILRSLSAHALAGEREKALAAGCNEFDTKPIEFDRLVATLRRILADLK
jgi:two-component system cell cycle response regulator DivK